MKDFFLALSSSRVARMMRIKSAAQSRSRAPLSNLPAMPLVSPGDAISCVPNLRRATEKHTYQHEELGQNRGIAIARRGRGARF